MISRLLKQDRLLASRIILALTTGMMLTCSAKISFGQSAEPATVSSASQSAPSGR